MRSHRNAFFALVQLIIAIFVIIVIMKYVFVVFDYLLSTVKMTKHNVLQSLIDVDLNTLFKLMVYTGITSLIGFALTILLAEVVCRVMGMRLSGRISSTIMKTWSLIFFFVFTTAAFDENLFSVLATLFSFLVLAKDGLFPRIDKLYRKKHENINHDLEKSKRGNRDEIVNREKE